MKQERQEVVKKEKRRKRDKPPPVIEERAEIRTSVRVEKNGRCPARAGAQHRAAAARPARSAAEEWQGPVDRGRCRRFPDRSSASSPISASRPRSRRCIRARGDAVRTAAGARHQGEQGDQPVEGPGARTVGGVGARGRGHPGKTVIGLEIPTNTARWCTSARPCVPEPYDRSRSPLTLALGKDIVGEPVVADLAKMPHALIAGTTGSGKSVAVNAMILSLVYKATAEEIRLIMIDPKMLELSVYEGIPHLSTRWSPT